MVEDAFRDLQQALFEWYEVKTDARLIKVGTIRGNAQVVEAGDGPPLVFLGGLGTPAALWAPLFGQLAARYSLYGIDMPRFGLTDGSVAFVDHYRSNAVRFLGEVLRDLGYDEVTLVGNSLGSLWTTWYAIEHPERVRALVHIGCPALALGTSAPMPVRLLSTPLGRLALTVRPPSPRQVDRLGVMLNQHPLKREVVRLLVATEQLPGYREMLIATAHRLLTARGARHDMVPSESELRAIDLPTLLIWGDRDPVAPTAVGERLARLLGGADYEVVAGGHMPWLNEAKLIGKLIADHHR